jgi:hypothetical protein
MREYGPMRKEIMKILLTPFRDQQAHRGSSLQLLCAGRSDRLGRAVRQGYRDQPAVDLRTSTLEGPR